ncbi:hypothetical protein Taro_003521, partial [Colocasia esculenta]|nr:hypothetical protein [Colocasia esculenta]
MENLSYISTHTTSVEKGMWGPRSSSHPLQPKRVKNIEDIYDVSRPQQRKIDTSSFQQYLERMFRHMMRTLGEERLVDVTILDCFWYHMYLNGSPKVMEWIKEKDIYICAY